MTTPAFPSAERSHAAGVAAAIADPDLLLRAVYAEHMIAPRGKSLVEMLADCSRLLRAQDAKHAAGHWTACGARRAALAQAEGALLALIVGAPAERREAA